MVLLLAVWWLPGCKFDPQGNAYTASNNNNTECGNHVQEGAEACDGADLAGATCVSLGFDSGSLACQGNCADFDTSACIGTGPVCGNDVQEGTEECDGTDLAGETCGTQGFDSGTLTCQSNCAAFDTSACTGTGPECGDDVQEGTEVCDGADLDGRTCVDEGYYAGTLECLGDCMAYDTTGCTGTCGDGTTNGPEVCDGGDVGLRTCVDEGYYTGTLGCLGDCTDYDTTPCSQTCGDGVINGPEVCDGGDVGGRTCFDEGYYTGTLGCLGDCTDYDTTPCSQTCGDGVINGPEECDLPDLGGSTCADIGCSGGQLGCNADCTFNPVGCYAGHDEDGDTVDDNCDNCPTYVNINQTDTDGDGVGDACEASWSGSLLSQIMDFRSLWTNTAAWTTVGGGTWTHTPDEYTGAAASGGDGNALHPTVIPNVAYSVEATFRTVATTPGDGHWTGVLFAWRSAPAVYAWACAYERGADIVSIWRVSGTGAFGLRDETHLSTSVTGGQWRRLRAFRDGADVRCVYDDQNGDTGQAQVTGVTVWSDMSGQTGLRVYNETTTFTSFVIYQ